MSGQPDSRRARTYPLARRKSKVRVREFARPHRAGASFKTFVDSLPDILAARDLSAVIRAIVQATRRGRPVIAGLGSHILKVGLNPVIIDLMERRFFTAIAMNGSGIIHDFELALVGQTSEEVEEGLKTGTFGMAEETGRMLNDAVVHGANQGMGMGEAVGRLLATGRFPYRRYSIAATAYRLKIPLTVHVALGTDIIHMHPAADGAAIGTTSMRDFRTFVSLIARLEGGVYLNMGSAVILPEVFLKALTLARNYGYVVNRFTTVNMDFLQHYRPLMNVVRRPTTQGGAGYTLTGHHELMVPLLAAGLIEASRGR